LCLLYVALTRARHATYMMIAPSSSREYSFPSKVSGLLRWSLLQSSEKVAPGATVFDVGNPDWFGELSQTTDRADTAPPQRSAAKSIRLAEMPTGRDRGLASVEPSSLEGAEVVRINELLSLDRAERLERGTLLHRWFEEIVWLDDGPPEENRLRLLAGVHTAMGVSVDEELSRFQGFLRHPAIHDALCRRQYLTGKLPLSAEIINEITAASPRLEVQREWRFAAPGSDGELMSGVIDRLVLLYHPTDYSLLAADIIDYKTDDVSDRASVERRVDFYREQILAYRCAVSSLYRIPQSQISARLLFVNSGDVCPIADRG
jgi:ATP-dependent exoDNAse (exonuclease V) beta subunit